MTPDQAIEHYIAVRDAHPLHTGRKLTAIEEARRIHSAHLDAKNAMHSAHRGTAAVCESIASLPKLSEFDVLVILHALHLKVERDPYACRLADYVMQDLDGLQAILAEEIRQSTD
jgi:hypothetical protein